MADGLRPNELDAKTSVDGSEEIVIDKSSWSKAFKITLTKLYNWIRTGLATTSYVDNEIASVPDEKVKATSQGTPGYLSAVLSLSNFLDNAGDSEQIIIEGRQASSTEVKSRSTNKVIIAPYQLPQITAGGQTFPTLGGSKSGKGVKVERISQTSQEIFKISLAIESLQSISGTDLSLMWFPVYDSDDLLNGVINGATLQQYLGGLSNWFMAVSPQTHYSNVPPYTSFITLIDNQGNEYSGISTSQFTVVDVGGHIANVNFTSALGNAVAATLVTDGTAFDSSGSVYGYATIKWTHPTLGGSITRTIELINNEPAGGGGAGGVDIAIQEVSAWPATSDDVDSNCVLINTTTQEMRYYYDNGSKNFCYMPFTNGTGACL